MSSPKPDERSSLLSPRGVYQSPKPTDLRSACPIVNSLANHGYIPRSGRNVTAAEMKAAIRELGIGSMISTALTYGAWLEHYENPPTGWWAFFKSPFAWLLRKFGLRDEGQVDAKGRPCLDLDQISRHGAVEHDVSLSRRDAAQGDNHSRQKDLVDGLLNCSRDGCNITTEDLAKYRRTRLEQQKKDNPYLLFGPAQNQMACGEGAFIQTVFGNGDNGWAVPVPYVKALFEEERLPVHEGWKRRSWWRSLTFIGLIRQSSVLQKAIGPIEQ